MRAVLISEFIGTLFLAMITIGSGIMGESLSNGNEAIALLANSLATGAGLFVLIQCLGPISGAHLNPVVSLVEALWGRLEKKKLFLFWIMQFTGAVMGVFLTHKMYNMEIIQFSTKIRYGNNLWLSEFIATFGLICTIAFAGRKHVEFAPLTIALYITSAYWFSSSTAFANPAITVARIFTSTFGGMASDGLFYYLAAQTAGAVLAFSVTRQLRELSRS